MKTLSVVILVAISAILLVSSCSKTNDNPIGAYSCTCYFADSASIDTFVVTYDREPRNTAKTQCAYTQAKYAGSAPSYQTVTCGINR